MIKQKCNLIVLAIYHDDNLEEETALLFSPISSYYVSIPTKHILNSTKQNDTIFVTEMKDAYFIPSADVEQEFKNRRKKE